MPNDRRAKKKISRKAPGRTLAVSNIESLTEQIQEVNAKARRAVAKTAELAAQSSTLETSADAAHTGIEGLHHNLEDAHGKIRQLKSKAAPNRKQNESRRKNPFLVVGIGASAGGFEALSDLLQNLRPDTGMAFVFVQHLDPTHESALKSLLSRGTKMEVVQIRDKMPLTPNKLFVIPPNRSLSLSKGLLRLEPRKLVGESLAIDQFFRSLAQEHGNRAVGVVLSGNGFDGSLGLKEIKAEGGITFAQDEQSAKFPAMPRNAQATGSVDLVLPPASIAEELERLAGHSSLRRDATGDPHPALPGNEEDLIKIFKLLRHVTGVDFSSYKSTTLHRRIMRRIVLKKIDTLGAYLRYLQQNSGEAEALFNDLLINVTQFFRDPSAFQALRKKIFPRIIKQKVTGSPIRIWVPGCATGEEVYSLAICVHEFLGQNLNNKAIQIFGTDISEKMVNKARLGLFPSSIAAQVGQDRLRRYFQKHDGGYQISKFIRDVCIFARQNVAQDPPFSKLDLISCRNLLIYLGLSLQKKVLPIFHYSLRPGGYLMLGSSETIGTFSNLFTLVDTRNKIFTRNETYTGRGMEFLPSSHSHSGEPRQLLGSKQEIDQFDLQKRADEIVLAQYGPPGVIVNSRMDVLHFRGKTGPYLEPAPGTASLNLMKMVRDEMAVDIRTTLAYAAKTNERARKEGIRLREEGQVREVTIEVVPFRYPPSTERFFLVLFRDTQPILLHQGSGAKKLPYRRAEQEVAQLRKELTETKESLQNIIEEQEATNEELKSANEEIQSSNEELQSTNEELETAKEELQSTNEELTTLNEELQTRNSELSLVNNDLNNLISSFSMPIVMLGNDLTIRRFTPLAQKIFNLIPSDIGRRISDINPNIALPNLKDLVTEVIDSLTAREVEVQDREGRWYSLRIRPYRTSDNKIEGAVIVLVDIAEVRQGLEEVAEIVPLPMLLLTPDLRVTKANQSFYDAFKITREDTEGQSLFQLGTGQWNNAGLRAAMETLLTTKQKIENFKVEHDFPRIGRKSFLVNARQLYQQSKGTDYVLVLLDEVLS